MIKITKPLVSVPYAIGFAHAIDGKLKSVVGSGGRQHQEYHDGYLFGLEVRCDLHPWPAWAEKEGV